MKRNCIAALAFFILVFCRPTPAVAAEIEFFAGAASKPAIQELVALFESETGHSVKLLLGCSENLLSQIKISRRGDLYFPGSPDYMQRAKSDGLIADGTEKIVAYLIPAINVARGNPKRIERLEDLARDDVRVAIANPHYVCVGLYAVELLELAGLGEEVRPRIMGYSESCAKMANLLSLGAADAILGWRVLESWNPDKIETVRIPAERLPRISYMPIAVTSLAKNVEPAKQLVEFACSEKGRKIFEKWGYITSEEEARLYAPEAEIGGTYILPQGW